MDQRRPTGITILAVLFFLAGASAALSGLRVLGVPIPQTTTTSFLYVLTTLLSRYQILSGISLILVGCLQIAVGWGLWTLRDWARIAAIILFALYAVGYLLVGLSLLTGITIFGITFTLPGPGIASLLFAAIFGWLIWYLLTPNVIAVFEAGSMVYIPPTPTIPAPPAPPSPPPPPAPTVPWQPPANVPSMRPPRQPTVPIGVPPAPEGWLVLRTGPRTGQQFGLKRGRNTIGRDPSRADIVLDDETVSGEHACIQFEQGQFFVYDLASTNGTYVNNRRIQKQMLMDGDVVRLGNVQLVFKRV